MGGLHCRASRAKAGSFSRTSRAGRGNGGVRLFGPVISAIAFKDTDELIKRANATMFGLGSGVWTTNDGSPYGFLFSGACLPYSA